VTQLRKKMPSSAILPTLSKAPGFTRSRFTFPGIANYNINRVMPLMIMLTPTRVLIAQPELDGHCTG